MTSIFFFFTEFFSRFTIFILISIFRSYLLSDKMTFERMFFSSHLFLTRPFFLLYLFSCFKNELNRNWWQNNFFPPPPPSFIKCLLCEFLLSVIAGDFVRSLILRFGRFFSSSLKLFLTLFVLFRILLILTAVQPVSLNIDN